MKSEQIDDWLIRIQAILLRCVLVAAMLAAVAGLF